MRLKNRLRKQNLILMKTTSFITSMLPFSLFLILKYHNKYDLAFGYVPQNILVNTIFIISVFSLVYIIYFFEIKMLRSKRVNRKSYHFTDINKERTNTTSYLLSNVLPVVTLEIDELYSLVFLIILILLLGFMYIRNNLYYINPIYDIINIKIYNAKVYEKGVENTNIKFIISLTPLYEFKENIYEGTEFGDILIINKKL